MRVQHHARRSARSTSLRRALAAGLTTAALSAPMAALVVPAVASAQPAPPIPGAPALPGAPGASETPDAPAAPAAPAAPGLPGLPGLPGAPASPIAESLTLAVTNADGASFPVTVDAAAQVDALKALVAEQTGIPAEQQRLLVDGDVELADGTPLAQYQLGDGDTVTLALR
ncbi:ubiquitin-like domain-containing protein [Nocardia sp. NPDC050718]|uniref:ubiquitin-like domain-containing protein n=1 Tax=Nocardia sp. NPDC050718 TaxID=3155788 RepID=UPI0033E19838